MNLSGASALVVGGAGGLGAASVRRLHAAGANVVIGDLAEESGNALAAELGSRALFVRTDVLDDATILEAIAAASEMGPLRVSVDTHGGPGAGRTIDRNGEPLPLEAFRRNVEIFLVGTFNVTRLAASAMSKTEPLEDGERGVIIHTASIAGYEGTVGQAAYAAAKGGIIGMTLTIARDLGVVGVRCVTIAPGTIATPAYGRGLEEVEKMYAPLVPFPRRMGRADEYGKLVVAIAENSYLNGEVIRLDGALRFPPKIGR